MIQALAWQTCKSRDSELVFNDDEYVPIAENVKNPPTIVLRSFRIFNNCYRVCYLSGGRAMDFFFNKVIRSDPLFRDVIFVEANACEEGCVNGGGNCRRSTAEIARLVANSALKRGEMLAAAFRRDSTEVGESALEILFFNLNK